MKSLLRSSIVALIVFAGYAALGFIVIFLFRWSSASVFRSVLQ